MGALSLRCRGQPARSPYLLKLMHVINIIAVAVGSALGGIGRYALSSIPLKTPFPFLTLLVNILGALLIGFIAGLAGRYSTMPESTVLFWKTGVCGGFTTFSTFALETCNLFRDGMSLAGTLYILLSVGGCVLGVLLGTKLSQLVGRS